MKERPILFSTPMVRAILDGRKTQTRRVMKPQPDITVDEWGGTWAWPSHACRSMVNMRDACCLSPYGARGDRLWVKETWRTSQACDPMPPSRVVGHGWPVWYAADNAIVWHGATAGGPAFTTPGKTRVSIHMPRAFSRITLEVTGVRVERLHAITEEDAKAEGVEPRITTRKVYPSKHAAEVETENYRDSFQHLWNKINGAESWISNPFVWVVSFKRVEQTQARAA